MSSECALQMYEVSLKYLQQLTSYRADTILCWTDRRKGQNKHARVMVLVHDTQSKCVLQMYEVSLKYSNSYQAIERTRNSNANDQREITKQYPKQSYGSCA